MEEKKKPPHEVLASKIPHNPMGKEVPKDPLAEAAKDALKFLNTLKAGDQINMGEVMSQVIILINFLLQENKKRTSEYRLLIETMNDLKELLLDIPKVKGKNYGVQESRIRETIFRWLRREGDR